MAEMGRSTRSICNSSLISTLQRYFYLFVGVTLRIRAAWTKWRPVRVVHFDKLVPIKLTGKFYRTVVKLALF